MTALVLAISALTVFVAQNGGDHAGGTANAIELRAEIHARPGNAAAHYQLGLILGKAGDFAAAEKEFRTVLNLNPNDAKAHFNLGLTLIGNPAQKLDWSGALAEFRAALAVDAGYIESRRMVAECLLNMGDPAGAIRQLQTVLETRPGFARARFSLACALEAASQDDEAISELRQVVEGEEGFAEAHARLGKLLAHSGQQEAAIAELEKALHINPDLADAHLALAHILRESGDARGALELEQSRRLAKRNSDSIQAVRLSNKGLEAADHGDMEGALGLLRQAVEAKPDYALAHYNLGLLLADSKDFRRAAEEFRVAGSLMPTSAGPWYSLGRVLEAMGDPAAAVGALNLAAQLNPDDGRAGLLAREIQTKNEGIKPKPPRLHANSAEGHNAAGIELREEGNLGAAMGEFLRALEIQPEFAQARNNLALTMSQRNDRAGAELELRKVMLVRAPVASHDAPGTNLKEKGMPQQ